MNIYFDNIVFFLQKAGGVSAYWKELTKRFISSDLAVKVIEQSESKANVFRRELEIPDSIRLRENNFPLVLLRYLPLQMRLNRGAIFHSSYYRISRQRQDVAQIVTVYDFTYEYFTHGVRRFIHHAQKRWAIRNADGIICISENTKRDLLDIFPEVDAAKIKVIYLGAAEDFCVLQEPPKALDGYSGLLQTKYILFIGDRSAYKNFSMAVEVLSELEDCHLVIVGGGALTESENRRLTASLGNRFTHLTGMASEKLNVLYNFAFCLLYPSSYEGFGIPVLEAMKAGCPVVTTSASSIPEVAGNAALMVKEVNRRAFIDSIKMLERKEIRLEIIRSGFEQASKFSWDKCFEETIQFYRMIHARKFSS